MFKCTYFPKPHVVPAYVFKPLSTFKTLSPWPSWLKCSQCFTYSTCFFIVISMLFPMCLPHVSLYPEKFLGYGKRQTQFLKPAGPCLCVLCEQESGKLQSPHWNLLLFTVCLEHPLHLSFKDGGGCQKLTEDLFSSLVMLRKGDSEKWRKAGRSVIASTWKYS